MNSEPATTRSRFKGFLDKFLIMRYAPRELWLIYGAYILENLAYKVGAAGVLTLWLSHDLGFSDTSAGATIAIWSSIMTLITVMIGSLTDALGIRRTFLIGFIVCLLSRTVMAFSVDKWVALPFGLYFQAVGIALMIPVMAAACKKYSNAAQRSVAFALYYALMNLGYAIGDWIFDRIRHAEHGLGEYGHWVVPFLGTDLSTYRVLILLSVVFTVPGLLLVWFFVRDGVEMTEEGIKVTPRVASGNTLLKSAGETASKTWEIFSSLWSQKSFYRFLAFMALVVGVKMIFYHLAYTFPKYGIRELGEGAPFAHLSGILNSMMIVFLVPIVGVLSQKISAYRMVTVGSLVSALSVFFIAVGASLAGRGRAGEPAVDFHLPVHRIFVAGRSAVVAAPLRIFRRHRAEGTGSVLHGVVYVAIFSRQILRGHDLGQVAGNLLSRHRPARFRHDVVPDRLHGAHHAGGRVCFSEIYSSPRVWPLDCPADIYANILFLVGGNGRRQRRIAARENPDALERGGNLSERRARFAFPKKRRTTAHFHEPKKFFCARQSHPRWRADLLSVVR
jgi:MFS family permease